MGQVNSTMDHHGPFSCAVGIIQVGQTTLTSLLQQHGVLAANVAVFSDSQRVLSPESMMAFLRAHEGGELTRQVCDAIMALHKRAIRWNSASGQYEVFDVANVKALCKQLVYLYTLESNVYKVVNSLMRANSHHLPDKCSAFVGLMQQAFRSDWRLYEAFVPSQQYPKLYRYCVHSKEELGIFDTLAIDVYHIWFGYISTTRDKEWVEKKHGQNNSSILHTIDVHDVKSQKMIVDEGVLRTQCRCIPIVAGQNPQNTAHPHENEVLLPPNTVMKLLQKLSNQREMLWTTTQFPSVWWRVENELAVEPFKEFARKFPHFVGSPDCKKSALQAIMTGIQKQAQLQPTPDGVDALKQRAIQLFSIACECGTNLNQKLHNGSHKASHVMEAVCEVLAKFDGFYQDRAASIITELAALGASPGIVVGGKTLRQLFPQLISKAFQAAVEVRPGRWQYYMTDSLQDRQHLAYGVGPGWHNYTDDGNAAMEAAFKQWLGAPHGPRPVVRSDHFSYYIDFDNFVQENTKTHTKRQILRKVLT